MELHEYVEPGDFCQNNKRIKQHNSYRQPSRLTFHFLLLTLLNKIHLPGSYDCVESDVDICGWCQYGGYDVFYVNRVTMIIFWFTICRLLVIAVLYTDITISPPDRIHSPEERKERIFLFVPPPPGLSNNDLSDQSNKKLISARQVVVFPPISFYRNISSSSSSCLEFTR